MMLLVRGGRFGQMVLSPKDAVLLTTIQNRTGEAWLDGAMMEGLELQLTQSPMLTVRTQSTYWAGVRQILAEDGAVEKEVLARRAAQAVRAKAYLFGEVRKEGGRYIVNVDLLDAQSNDRLASVVETADGREGIVPAIDRIATEMRSKMGESKDQSREQTWGWRGREVAISRHCGHMRRGAGVAGGTYRRGGEGLRRGVGARSEVRDAGGADGVAAGR